MYLSEFTSGAQIALHGLTISHYFNILTNYPNFTSSCPICIIRNVLQAQEINC